MKRIMAIAAATLLMMSCGGTKNPEKVVERCWKQLSEGDYAGAVELMDAEPEEVELYVSIFAEQCGELQAAGGVKEFQLLGSSVGVDDATVDAAVILANGQRIEATYNLILRDDKWLIAH